MKSYTGTNTPLRHIHIPCSFKKTAYRCVAMAEKGRLHNAGLRNFMCMGERCILDNVLAQGRQDSRAGPQHGSASSCPAAARLQHLQLLQAAGMQRVLQQRAVLPCSLHALQEECTQCMPATSRKLQAGKHAGEARGHACPAAFLYDCCKGIIGDTQGRNVLMCCGSSPAAAIAPWRAQKLDAP